MPALRFLVLLFLVLSTAAPASASHVYSIPDRGPAQQAVLLEHGLDLIGRDADGDLLVVAAESDRPLLDSFGAPAVLRAREGSSIPRLGKGLAPIYDGYHTYAETQALLRSLADTHPALCELSSMGTSHEGRDIPVLRVTNLSLNGTGKPEVLIFGNLHARELMSVEIPLRFAHYLLENYGVDAQVTHLVDTRDLYVAPMMNPDGHVHVENNSGAADWWAWWRKNRRPNADGSIGVDLNRNFSYEWAHDDIGSSWYPGDLTYRGPAPLSEPETRALADFVAQRDFVIGFSYHSFSELLLYPWGYGHAYTVDHELFHTLARRFTAENGYLPGNVAEGAIYLANGNSDDWAYGTTQAKNSFLNFTVEVNSWADGGFAPPDSLIQPTFQKMLPMNLRLLEVADEPRRVLGPIPPLLDANPVFAAPVLTLEWSSNLADDPNPAEGYAVEEYRGIESVEDPADSDSGLWDFDGFSISPLAASGAGSYYSGRGDNLANSITARAPYSVTPATQTLHCRLRYEIEDHFDYAYLVVSTDGGLIWRSVPGNLTTDFNPYGRNHGNGITGSTGTMWLDVRFDLSEYLGQTVLLRFLYDTDGAGTRNGLWIDEISPVPRAESERVVVSGHPATSLDVPVDQAGTYAYRVRGTDAEGDASRWSNLVTIALDPVVAVDEPGVLVTHLEENYPNPFNPRTVIDYTVGRERGDEPREVRLEVFDLAGRRVRRLWAGERIPGTYRETWTGTDHAGREVASGIYVARLAVDGEWAASRKMTLLR